jgi:predicted alpha/beta hydrolase family esterase
MNLLEGSLFPESPDKLVITAAPSDPERVPPISRRTFRSRRGSRCRRRSTAATPAHPKESPAGLPAQGGLSKSGVPVLPTVLVVPGLRDHGDAHWQTLLAADLEAQGRKVRTVAPMGRDELDCAGHVEAIERAANLISGPLVIVAHSAGALMVAHWARRTRRPVQGALLAVPPDFEQPMPHGYPTLDALHDAGWLPVPRRTLPFRSIVAASRNDPLASFGRVVAHARDWGSELFDLGEVGHLNPASGFGPWPLAAYLVRELGPSLSVAD